MSKKQPLDPMEIPSSGKSVDWISKLPNDVLLMILSRLSTEEAVRSGAVSKRWEHVWKHMSHLVLDMRKIINSREMLDVRHRVATLMTKVINNHRGHLESCVIDHYPYRMLNTWTQSLTGIKHTKHLILRRHDGLIMNSEEFRNLPPHSFSYPSLTSLSLQGYILETSHSLNNCQNLKTLKLHCISAFEVGLFNRVLESCPSLEVLVLNISCSKKSGPLKIDNNILKLLQVYCDDGVDGVQVSSPSLHILAIDQEISCGRDDFVLTSPRLQFYRNYWLTRTLLPHISYNISQEEKNSGYEEFLVNTSELLRISLAASLSVSVDLMNPREVERLRQVLLLWTCKMVELEILFKNNNAHREEKDESSQKKLLEENNKEPFPNAVFSVYTVWMHNFSGSEEEFALASCLIRQKTVVKKMMIKTTSFSAKKKLEIETAVAKLQALQTKDQWQLTIKCF